MEHSIVTPSEAVVSVLSGTEPVSSAGIAEIVMRQRAFFDTGVTRSYSFRLQSLHTLLECIRTNEEAIYTALYQDLRKPRTEAYLTEYAFLMEEIKYAIKYLRQWMKPIRASMNLIALPGRAMIESIPYGVTLTIAPWNYPFQLALAPVIAALSAGNTCVVKPSEFAPAVSRLLAEIIASCFEKQHVAVVEGDHTVSAELLRQPFNYVFFTGGTEIGTKIATACAQQLIPYTLELGGKSPCIVDTDIDLKTTAKRIVWGKYMNAGQTCIAPDYVMVHHEQYEPLLRAMKQALREFYGDTPQHSKDYARIIHDRHFDRLVSFLDEGHVYAGGAVSREERFIEPTILIDIKPGAHVMTEEIFGPILPVLSYRHIDDAIRYVRTFANPLALYLFSNNRTVQQKVMESITFGGGCINDTLFQISVPSLPFGGVGKSGSGAYHGKHGFDTFSHKRSVVRKYFWADIPLRYAPYTNAMSWFKKLLRD